MGGLTGGGCSALTSPTVSLGAAEVTDASVDAIRFDVTARLENADREAAYELRTLQYTVSVGDRSWRGQRAAEATLAPGGDAMVRIPVILRREIWASVTGAGGDTEVPWRIDGQLLYVSPGPLPEMLLDAGIVQPKVGVRGRGTVMLPPPPAAPAS
ncbi:MAG: hypothetical protein AB8G96_14805 [Phycisphaerales bacterium]